MHDQQILVLFDGHAVGLQAARHRINPVAFLDPQFLDAAHDGLAGRKSRHNGQDRIFVNHAGRPLRWHLDALQRRRLDAQIGHRLAALFAGILKRNIRAHFDQSRVQPIARRVLADTRNGDFRPLDDQRRTDGEGRRRRITRHRHALRFQLGIAGQSDHPALIRLLGLNIRTEPRQHALCVIACGFFFDHNRLARRIQSGQENRRFHLRRRHRNRVAHRSGICRTHDGHGQTPAVATIGLRTKQCDRVRDPRHRAGPQTGIAREGGRDIAGGHGPHDQPHTGARIAAINHLIGLCKSANADAMHRPVATAMIRHLGTKGPHRARRIQHIVALKQTADRGFANAQRAQDQRTVRNGLVTRHGCDAR